MLGRKIQADSAWLITEPVSGKATPGTDLVKAITGMLACAGVQGFKMDLLVLEWLQETARYREGRCLVMKLAVPTSRLWCLHGTPVWVLGACLDHDL